MGLTSQLSVEEILLTLVQGDDGEAWAATRNGWTADSDIPVCEWDGVICSEDDADVVEGLDLDSAGLIGTIPRELGLLNTLTDLSMPQNSLNGTIPELVSNLPHLETLNLAENELSGPLPAFASPVLTSLELQHNLFTGTIPFQIGLRHGRLTYLDLSNNLLEGTIPGGFENLKLLQTLALAENRISGSVPQELGGMRSLIFLFLNGNELMGTIPLGLASSDSMLAEVWLQHNMLSGTIPAALAEIKNLTSLYLDGNKFTGTVPPPLCDKKLNEDFFQGAPPNTDKDYCTSIACPVGYFSLEGVYPCKQCPKKFSNPYLGRIGTCVDLDQDDILNAIYDTWKINAWKEVVDQTNALGAMAPDDWCGLPGVTCDEADNVVALHLKGMGITGRIPEELGFLEFLKSLDLSDNYLTGYIPTDLRWAPLQNLDLSGNELVGMVPSMLCLKPNINGNGDKNVFGCSYIACPVKTYSLTGWGNTLGEEGQCIPCRTATYLGSKDCPAVAPAAYNKHHESVEPEGEKIFGVFVGIMITIVFGALIFLRYFGSQRLLLPTEDDDDVMFVTEIEVNDDHHGRFRDITLNDDKSVSSDNAIIT